MRTVGTVRDPVRYLYVNRSPVPRTAHGHRVRHARSTVCTRSPSLAFPQVRSHLKRFPPRPGDGRIRPTHSPQDTADDLMNRSLSRGKPVTQSSVTGSDLRKCVAGVVSRFRTSRTGCLKTSRTGSGAPPATMILLVRGCRDVKGQARHHRRHCREAPGQRGRAGLRGRPVLGLRAAGPLPGRGRRSVRAAVPAAEDLPLRDQRRRRRPDHPSAQGPRRPGPGRRPADHRLAPAAASPGQRLGRDRQQVPEPGRAGHSRPGQAAEVVLHPVPGGHAERALAVRLHPLPARRRDGHRDPDLARRPLPLRPVRHRPRPRHRARCAAGLPRSVRAARRPGLDPDRQRHGLHHPPLRRQGRPQRPRARTAPPRHHPEEQQAEPPPRPRAKSSASSRP